MSDAGNATEPLQGQKEFVFHFLAHCDFCGVRTTAEIMILDKNKLIVFPSNPIKILYFLHFSFLKLFLCLTLERKKVVTGPFPITAHKSSLYSDEDLTLLTFDWSLTRKQIVFHYY